MAAPQNEEPVETEDPIETEDPNTPPIISDTIPARVPELQTTEAEIKIDDDSDIVSIRFEDLPDFIQVGNLSEVTATRTSESLELVIEPAVEDIGSHTFKVIADDGVNIAEKTYTLVVFDTQIAPTSSGFSESPLNEGDRSLSLNLFDIFEDRDNGSENLSYSIIRNSNPFIYRTIAFDSDTGMLSFTFDQSIRGILDMQIQAKDSDNLSATVDIFISLRDSNVQATRVAASAEEVTLRPAQILAKSVPVSVEILAGEASFSYTNWESESASLYLKQTAEDEQRALFKVTYNDLETGESVETLLPITVTPRVFDADIKIVDGWMLSDLFGLYTRSGEWLYSKPLGWLFIDSVVGEKVSLYSPTRGWFYTEKSFGNYLFDWSDQSWKYIYVDNTAHAFIYDFSSASYSKW